MGEEELFVPDPPLLGEGEALIVGIEAALWFGVTGILTLGSLSGVDWAVNGAPDFFWQGLNRDVVQVSGACRDDGVISSEGMLTVVFLGLWLFFAWHRLMVLFGGVDAIQGVVVVGLPSWDVPAVVCYGRFRWKVWLCLVVLFGLCGFAEGQRCLEDTVCDRPEGVSELGLVLYTAPVCLEREAPRNETNLVVWKCVEVAVVIVAWETLKRMCCRRRIRLETVESQTQGTQWVPFPLEPGVPNRAGILYSLWRAGYQVDADQYPEDVQYEYFQYIGSFLRRQAVDGADSD